MGTPESELEAVRKVTQEALKACSNPAEVIRQARAGLLESIATRNASRGSGWSRRSVFRVWGLACASAAAAALIFGFLQWSSRPISFQVGPSSTTGRSGDLIEASTGSPVSVQFSEGSSFLLQSGGRARVLATEGRGARVLIDSGDMDVAIARSDLRPGRWSFEAGPFLVKVTGTRFHLAWQPTSQRFALATTEGRVVVSGSCMGSEQAVAAGESMELSCATFHSSPTAALAEPALGADSAEPQNVVDSPNTEPSALKPTSRLPSWRERIAAGRLTEGLRAAEQAGFARVCQEATLKELVALAGAARLSGRTARATEALRAIRQRFPSTMDASTAAFTLGRIAFEQRNAYEEAAYWFGTYLTEQPSGPLMGDSVGRLMEARQHAGDLAGARQDAERYLRRFPKGPYASEARAVLQK